MAAEKERTPQEPVAVALTPEEWRTVLHWLQYGADYHNAKKWEWRANCQDKRMAAQIVAEHETAEAEAKRVHKVIEDTLHPTPTPKTCTSLSAPMIDERTE